MSADAGSASREPALVVADRRVRLGLVRRLLRRNGGVRHMKRYWLCRKCGNRWERTKQKCGTAGCDSARPKKRQQPHMRALDNSYETFRDFNERVHGPAHGPEWQADDCGVCGKPPGERGNHDRDHGHRKGENSYGKMRGLACPGDSGCNMLMKGLTAVRAREIADYMERAELENAA